LTSLDCTGFPGNRHSYIAKNFRAIQAVCLARDIDNPGICLASNDRQLGVFQFIHAVKGQARRRNDHCYYMTENNNSLRLRQVADITADNREVYFPAANCLAASTAVPVSTIFIRTDRRSA